MGPRIYMRLHTSNIDEFLGSGHITHGSERECHSVPITILSRCGGACNSSERASPRKAQWGKLEEILGMCLATSPFRTPD